MSGKPLGDIRMTSAALAQAALAQAAPVQQTCSPDFTIRVTVSTDCALCQTVFITRVFFVVEGIYIFVSREQTRHCLKDPQSAGYNFVRRKIHAVSQTRGSRFW